MNKNSIEEIPIQLEHFKANMKKTIKYFRGVEISHFYEIGSVTDPCLNLSIYTNQTEIPFPDNIKKVASLEKIKKLEECIIDFDKQIYDKYSFSVELLKFMIEYIKTNYKYITQIRFTDESIIPCSNIEELDLMSYSIAMNGKSWYELNFNALLENKTKKTVYEEAIKNYKSLEFKKQFNWEQFYLIFIETALLNVPNLIKPLYSEIEKIFNSSSTFPEFFKKLKSLYSEDKKCLFYKSWLKKFIFKYIPEERSWLIPLQQQGGNRKTIKKRKSNKKY